MRRFTCIEADVEYRNDDGSVIRRERGTETGNGLVIDGEWVLRGPDGALVDYHQYRTDLESRNNVVMVDEPSPAHKA